MYTTFTNKKNPSINIFKIFISPIILANNSIYIIKKCLVYGGQGARTELTATCLFDASVIYWRLISLTKMAKNIRRK